MPETSLVVAGFSRLTSLDRRLLLGLVDRFEQSVILYCSNPQAAETVFRAQEPFQTFLQDLRDSSADLQEDRIEDADRNRSCALLPLAELIFHDNKKNHLFPASAAVKLVQAENRYSEVTSIARHILEIGRQGTNYGQIRLVFSDYELYTTILLEVFPRYGIPYRLLKGTPLKLHPLAGIVQSLVAQAVNPNPYPLREKIFSSPYVSFSCLVEPEDLVRFALDKDIPIEKETIENAIPEPRRFALDHRWCLQQQRRAARVVKSPEKLEPVRLAARYLEEHLAEDPEARRREMLNLLINFYVLSQAERSLYVWHSKMTPSAFCRSVQKLIDRFHVEENVHIQDNRLQEEPFNSLAARDKLVLKTLDLLRKNLQAHFNLLSGGEQESEQKYPLLNLVGTFTGLMSDPELTLPSSGEDGVAVFASSDVPDSFYPVTFIGGLVDGAFPAKEPFNFLAPRKEGPGGESLLIDIERQNLYQILAGTTERLYLYFPFSDGGKKLLTSPFVAEIERCLTNPAAGERSEKGFLKDASLCCNTREKLIFAGRNLDRAYSQTLPVLQELKSISTERFRHIANIFRCDGLRGSPDTLSCFDGIFEYSTETARAAQSIDRQMDNAAFIEVEQLERYAGCPLRFLFDDLARLKPDYLIDYHPDRTDRGLLIKKILAAYSAAAVAEMAATEAEATDGASSADVAAASAATEAAAGSSDAAEPTASATPEEVAAITGGRRMPDNPEEVLLTIAEQAFSQMPSREDDLFSGSYQRFVLRGLAQPAPAGQSKTNQGSGTGSSVSSIADSGAGSGGTNAGSSASSSVGNGASSSADSIAGSGTRSGVNSNGADNGADSSAGSATGNGGSVSSSTGNGAGSIADSDNAASGTASSKRRPGLLSSFLDCERSAPDFITPYLAGLDCGDFKAAGIPVRIAIERADITFDGEFLIIYAYSIADLGNLGRINKGLRFQAPLMILALRDYLQKKGLDTQVGGAGVYLVRNPRMIKRGGYFALQQLQASRRKHVNTEQPLFSGQRQYGFLPAVHFERELEETDRRVGRIDALIRKGRFNPPLCAVKDQTCMNCAFTRICRKDQLRLDKIYTTVDDQEIYKPRRKIELSELETEE